MVPDQSFCFPRRADEVVMNVLGRFLHTLRVWTGLADASEAHLTPSHGWLLPAPVEAVVPGVAVPGDADARHVPRAER
jgi:hypothetical protein